MDASLKKGGDRSRKSMLQSEYDAIVRQKRLKILLIILTTIVVAVVVYAVIKVGKEEVMVPEPTVMAPKQELKEAPTPEEVQKQLDILSQVPEGTTPPPQPSPEEIQKKLDELSKTLDGTTPPQPSQEEIMKRLDELSAKK